MASLAWRNGTVPYCGVLLSMVEMAKKNGVAAAANRRNIQRSACALLRVSVWRRRTTWRWRVSMAAEKEQKKRKYKEKKKQRRSW